MKTNWANCNELWADVIAESLHRKGVEYAITCPGSRSSPLTFAFAEHSSVEAIPVLDERSAAFFALGLAKSSGRPVALVCTSGSAVANFFPAVVEASESGVPLVLLTADRPAELRDCQAGQTIDQVKLFGGYVRKQVELAVPEASLQMLRYLRQTVAHAIELSTAPDRGPVHLNIPFRDPLIPLEEEGFVSPLEADSFSAFFEHLESSDAVPFVQAQLPEALGSVEKGLILLGPASPVNEEGWCENVASLAKNLGWPVLSDALNPTRSNAGDFSSLVCGYDFLLRNETLAKELKPEHVLVIGSFPTSKILRAWVGSADVTVTVLSDRPVNVDATHSKATRVFADFEFGGVLAPRGTAAEAYKDRWLGLDEIVQTELVSRFDGEEAMVEAKLAWALSRCLPGGSSLCVSNSMPPRDLEFYFSPRKEALSVYSSRGANGIDGILSTAMGVAHDGEPTVLLTGDLALLHDSNGALIAKGLKGSLTILLVNNSGGGIFEMLPVSKFETVFEKHYGTDQKVDFADWAKTYGIRHESIDSWDLLKSRLQDGFEGVRLLEIRTDRKRDAAYRKELFQVVAKGLV